MRSRKKKKTATRAVWYRILYVCTCLLWSSAFGMTIQLISASVHDYNDNTSLCYGGGVRGGAQCPLRGAQVFRLKFFQRRCASGQDHLLARLSCLYAPIQKGWTTGCRVNVISRCVFVPSPLGFIYLADDNSREPYCRILSSRR